MVGMGMKFITVSFSSLELQVFPRQFMFFVVKLSK